MWVYSGLHHAPYNIFDFRVSRHRDGPDEFLRDSHCMVQADCFSGNTSVIVHSDGRLEFVACWSHARRKVKNAQTHRAEADTLEAMIHALYDIETRGKNLSWEAASGAAAARVDRGVAGDREVAGQCAAGDDLAEE